MSYYYMIVYSYEEGYSMTDIYLNEQIMSYADIEKVQKIINKKKNIHSTVLDYRLIAKFPRKMYKSETMDSLEYLEYLKECVGKWNKINFEIS